MSMSKSRFIPHRPSKAASLAAGLLTLALAVWPAEAWGKPWHGHGRKVVHHVYVGPRHFVPPRVVQRIFVAPKVIYQPYVSTYQPYYYGQVFYPAGGRYVAVYAFPVIVNGVPVYTPYAYDGGRLLSRGYFTASGPRFSFGIGF
ncbi:MAG: hypothetical protein ACREN5_01695 [Gemmatimonadales bacterium]